MIKYLTKYTSDISIIIVIFAFVKNIVYFYNQLINLIYYIINAFHFRQIFLIYLYVPY